MYIFSTVPQRNRYCPREDLNGVTFGFGEQAERFPGEHKLCANG